MSTAELRAVTKAYQEGDRQHQVLRGLEFDISPGEIAVVRGPSGSGKSTILNLLAGLDLPDEGEVWCAGKRMDQDRFHAQIVGHAACMLSARSAKTAQGVLGHVITALDR